MPFSFCLYNVQQYCASPASASHVRPRSRPQVASPDSHHIVKAGGIGILLVSLIWFQKIAQVCTCSSTCSACCCVSPSASPGSMKMRSIGAVIRLAVNRAARTFAGCGVQAVKGEEGRQEHESSVK